MPTPLQRKGPTHTSLLFESPRQPLPVLSWPSKRRGGRPRPTSCSGSGVGTTPGQPRQERGLGLHGRGSSASARRARLRLLVMCATGFLPPHTLLARPTHVQRAQLAGGTSFRFWGLGVGPCHHLLRQMWSGVQGTSGRAVPQLQRISWRSNIAAPQIEVLAVSKQTLPWLDGGARASAHPGRGNNFGGAAGILQGGSGPNRHGALHTQDATCCPAGSGTGTLGAHCRGGHNRGPAAMGPGGGRVCWRRVGSTISWCQSLPSRLRVLVLTRQTDALATHTVFNSL